MIYKSLIRAVVGEGVRRQRLRSMWAIRALALLPAGMGLVHQERDFMEPGFDFSKLEVVKEFYRNNNDCHYVKEKVTVYAYNWVDKQGNIVKDTLGTTNVFEEERRRIGYSDGTEDLIVLRHSLNCLDQSDQLLIDTIKDKLFSPPKFTSGPHGFQAPADNLFRMLTQRYFTGKKYKRKGFFIELVSNQGGTQLTKTSQFSSALSWSGLLIHPIPRLASSQGSKAWSVQTCLSTSTTPEIQNFSMNYLSLSQPLHISNLTDDTNQIPMQCMPLSSLILALGSPTVDVLVLTHPSAEYLYSILATVSWSSVLIRTIVLSTGQGQVRENIVELLARQGLSYLGHVGGDAVFVLLDQGGTCDKQRHSELLSRTGPASCHYPPQLEVGDVGDHCRSQHPADYFLPVSPSTAPGPLYWVPRIIITSPQHTIVIASWLASTMLRFIVEVLLPRSDIYRAVIKLVK